MFLETTTSGILKNGYISNRDDAANKMHYWKTWSCSSRTNSIFWDEYFLQICSTNHTIGTSFSYNDSDTHPYGTKAMS